MAKPRQVSKRELQKRQQKRLARHRQPPADTRIVQQAAELIERHQSGTKPASCSKRPIELVRASRK